MTSTTMNTRDRLFELKQLCKVFQAGDVETTALRDIDLQIERGEFVAIMGPSGCGKSTLLNVIGMLDAPTSGRYLFGSEDIARYDERRLASIRKRNVGFIFQSFNLIDEMNVFENIELALLYHQVSAAERRARVQAALEKLGIGHRARHYPRQLSGGQQQRVAVARAVVARPTLILADEPTGNLDSSHGDEVMGMLRDLNGEGTTIVMVTHSSHHARAAHRTVHLLDGALVSSQQRIHMHRAPAEAGGEMGAL